MRVEIDLTGVAFVRWRSVAGHLESGQFIVDDQPGERTGPWGVTHVARGDGRTLCDRTVPVQAEEVDDRTGRLCSQCLARGDRR